MKKSERYIATLGVVLCIGLMTIAYSAFQSNLMLKDLSLVVRQQKEIRITSIKVDSVNQGAFSNYEDYNITNIHTSVTLPNEDSTITYEVEVTNIGNVVEGIYDIKEKYLTTSTEENNNLEIKDTTLNLKEALCDDNNKEECTLGSISTFKITIGYQEGKYQAASSTHLVTLSFTFKRVYPIIYQDFESPEAYPTEIMESDSKEIQLETEYNPPWNVEVINAIGEYDKQRNRVKISNPEGEVIVKKIIRQTSTLINKISSMVEGKEEIEGIINVETTMNCDNTFMYDKTSDNNLRYIGPNPCNYVYFNCNPEKSPSATTCELWRIIGLMNVDGTTLVKIVRNSSIGEWNWDSSKSPEKDQAGTESNNGFNDWREADIMHILNPINEEYNYSVISWDNKTYEDANKAVWWNRTVGVCARGNSNDVRDCDFTTTGLYEETKNYIEEVVWNIAGTAYINNSFGTPQELYQYEKTGRKNTIRPGRSNIWQGKVGLISPSDFAFASGPNCISENPRNWNDFCSDNYLNKGYNYWTITLNHNNNHYVLYIDQTGHISDTKASSYDQTKINVVPSLYLKSSILTSKGTGSLENPYILTLE